MDRKHFDDDHVAFGEAFRAFADKVDRPQLPRVGARRDHPPRGLPGGRQERLPGHGGARGVRRRRGRRTSGSTRSSTSRSRPPESPAPVSASRLHNDICLPYFLTFCTDEQKQRWLPGIASGELITAVAMTEPGAGSDLAGIRTTAVRDGDHYVVNGSKTFITNGINADLVITAVPPRPTRHKARGMSLLIVERGMPGFERGRNLDKLGLHCAGHRRAVVQRRARARSTTCSARRASGFAQLTAQAARRSACRSRSPGSPRRARRSTRRVRYVQGAQGVRHDDRLVPEHASSCSPSSPPRSTWRRPSSTAASTVLNDGELSAADASKAKWWCTELQGRVVDKCLQLHGGYGYMTEYAISRRYADARVTRIYGGSTRDHEERRVQVAGSLTSQWL